MLEPRRRKLAEAIRLIVITDRRLAGPRPVKEIVAAVLDAGARAVQLRDKDASAATQLTMALELRDMTRRAGALLFVNDRADVALASGADGVHLGPDDLPVAAVRRAAPVDLLIGYSADDPEEARKAEADGADYIGCGAVWGTGTKDVGGEAIGLKRLAQVAAAVTIPVVAIGGVTPARAAEVPATRASGTAVVGAVMAAGDPAAAVRALLEPWRDQLP
jgi:thiamine-phosphate pyrophosphorylase